MTDETRYCTDGPAQDGYCATHPGGVFDGRGATCDRSPSDFPGPHQCEARTGWDRGSGYVEYIPIRCRRSIGVVWFEDAQGEKRYHCPIPEHRAQLVRTWGERAVAVAP